MKIRVASIAIVLFGLSAIAAAQDGSPYEKSLLKVLDSFDKISNSLKTIVSEDTAAAAKPKLREAADAFVEARTAATKLDPPEKAEKVRLERVYRPKIDEAMKKMFVEAVRVNAIPGGRDALKEIAGVLKKDGK